MRERQTLPGFACGRQTNAFSFSSVSFQRAARLMFTARNGILAPRALNGPDNPGGYACHVLRDSIEPAPYPMKCSKHSAEAVAVCAYCGRALCNDCIQSPAAPRMVCSNDCLEALRRADQTAQMILQRGVQKRAGQRVLLLCDRRSLRRGSDR